MPWRKDLIKRIESFRELGDNWDSYGSRKISEEAIKKAKYFIDGLFVAPVSGGGIQIELGDGEVFILIHPDGTWETGCVTEDDEEGKSY